MLIATILWEAGKWSLGIKTPSPKCITKKPHPVYLLPRSNGMDIFENYKNTIRTIAPLTEQDCALFQPFLKIKSIPKDGNFVLTGQVSREIGFVHKGLFRYYYLQEGREINTHFVFENNFIVSYNSFITQQPSSYFIQALEPAEIVTFTFNDLQHAYHASHRWERFGRIVAENAFMLATQRSESFLFMDGEQRYLHLLKTRPEIFDRLPLYHIASYLGMERESLSRLRKKIYRKLK